MEGVGAGAEVGVDGVDARGVDFDEDGAGGVFGVGGVGVFEYFGTAEAVDDYGLNGEFLGPMAFTWRVSLVGFRGGAVRFDANEMEGIAACGEIGVVREQGDVGAEVRVEDDGKGVDGRDGVV